MKETTGKLIDSLLADPPMVHMDGTGVWGLAEDVLRYIDATLKPGAKTLETGAGLSTLLFAAQSEEHTCIVPSDEEIERIRAYSQRKQISVDHVQFISDYSQNVLPGIERQELDLVLIDGGHGYPIPAIDWFYTAPMLKRGGIMIIDDVHVWTGLELKRFLSGEEAWKPVGEFSRSSAYAKVGEDHGLEWCNQPYVVRKSRMPRLMRDLRISFSLLSRGELSLWAQKVKKKLKRG